MPFGSIGYDLPHGQWLVLGPGNPLFALVQGAAEISH